MSQRVTKTLGLIALTSISALMDAQVLNWAPAGPIYTAGRARNLIVDKTDVTGNTMYVGSASSGIFVTTNGGIKWSPASDQGTVRNISYLAQAADGTIYAATGEGFLRPDKMAKAQTGTGLYKLTGTLGNYALTLVQGDASVGAVINRVACHPTNSQIIALATNKGILISNDAGASFNPAVGITATVNVTYGMDLKFDNAGILYCSIGNERAIAPYSNVSTKVYKSNSSLSLFTDITPISGVLSDSNYGRIELAIAPSDNDVIYASCAKKYVNGVGNSASLQGLFVSYDAGLHWGLILQGAPQLDPLGNGSTVASGDYSQVLLVNPTNSNQLFFGGYSFYMFTKTGGSTSSPIGVWTQVGSPFALNSPYYLHQNIHDIKIVNGNPIKFYFVTDAGIYRSTDMVSSSVFTPPSFQPFYKGLITGQFNSVSIETYPLATTPSSQVPAVTPFSGFIGGTGGNGLTYYSGKDTVVTQETNYLGGDVYNSEFSKILPGVALFTTNNGGLYRSSNIKNSDPNLVDVNVYSGALSKLAPSSGGFSNNTYTTSGTPFKLWENYGQVKKTPDSLVFYNDTLRFQASIIGVSTLTSQNTFTFSAARPNRFALIDSIAIRTGTVILPISAPFDKLPTPFTGSDKKDITIKLSNTYTTGSAASVPPITGTAGPMSTAGVTLNPVTLLDNISITFTAPPFATKTISTYYSSGTVVAVSDPAAYYRVFATIFYKYKAGDTIKVTDNNISTRVTNYSKVLTQPLSWDNYGTRPVYLLTATSNSAISNPTYVLNPGNITQSSPVFSVSPVGVTNYTISASGNYTYSAIPINNYSISAVTNTAITSPTYNLMPGNVTQTTAVFIVTPTISTNYTITESGSGTLTGLTYSTVGTSTYVLNPGNVVQSTPVFTVTVSSPTTFTLQGLSSNTLSAANTTTNYTQSAAQTFSTAGSNKVLFSKKNPLQKIAQTKSARIALALSQTGITNNGVNSNAIVVSKAPLNLNDPLNFVRVSQNGCFTSDAQGVPTFSTISIPGKPTVLEWSKSGSELYYATDDNKLYRVSNIYSIMDLSPSSYSGKLSTDIFKYADPLVSGDTNRVSPYRTTLLGTFTKPITSISITKNDSLMAITFNDPTGTIVSYSTNDIRKSNFSNINFVSKNGTGLSTASVVAYCSLMEKGDNRKVFIGTDNGIFYTNDITAASPTWAKANNGQLPNVQIFDIKQQVLDPWDCYNSGQIYVATNGRGVWTNNSFFAPYTISVKEIEKPKTENNLSIYPNPSNGAVYVSFNSIDGESASVNVMDINGRIVKSENLGKLNSGEVNYSFETGNLSSGIYIVSVNGTSGTKRIAKLIVTK